MASFFEHLLLSFIPIFVAMDAIGTLPIVLGLSEHMMASERTRMVRQAMITALGLGLGFIALGKIVFLLIGIEVADFLVAGGLILLILAIRELLTERRAPQIAAPEDMIGVVPIGTPLVVGPAVLTTLLLLIDRYSIEGVVGISVVIISFVLNLAIAWLLFAQGNRVANFMGKGGLRAASKISMLLLAAIAVKMIREGVLGILAL